MTKRIISRHMGRSERIKWRSHEPTRLETFSDAIFAFALTLLILSLEVPKTFTELLDLMKGGLSFAASFTLLFVIWNTQNTFFRRFGLLDAKTVFLNGALLFVSLVYIYPLKFLSLLVLGGDAYNSAGEKIQMIKDSQVSMLMIIYGIGYSLIYLLFYFMYKNARSFAEELELTPVEIFETQTITSINLMSFFIGLISIILAIVLPGGLAGLSGFVYCLIGPMYLVWYTYRARISKKRGLI